MLKLRLFIHYLCGLFAITLLIFLFTYNEQEFWENLPKQIFCWIFIATANKIAKNIDD